MKNIFLVLRLENIKKHLLDISRRFPLSAILIVLLCWVFLGLLHGTLSEDAEKQLTRSAFTLVVTFFLSVGTYIASESFSLNDVKRYLAQLLPLLFGVLFFHSFSANLNDFENFILFIISLFGIIAFLFFAPYIREVAANKGNQDVYYSYFYKISIVFLWSAILGGFLFALGGIAIGTVLTLFDITWAHSDKLYGDWAIFALSFVTPLFALTQLPKKSEFHKDTFDENAFFSFLIKFVATPFILIYFVILYAYTVKVLMNFSDWPKGEICWMVIGFSIFGYITYIFSYAFDEKEKLIKMFRKYFPLAVIPQLGMLFYAIYLRIGQYDITTNRYFVVVFGIWLLTISLYLVISKKKYLGYILSLITLFTIIISVGPWSVYSLPEARQLARLKTSLTAVNILQAGIIVPLSSSKDIDPKLSGEIYDGIQYLCNLDDCNSIKTLFPNQYAKLESKHAAEFEDQIVKDKEYYKNDQKQLQEIEDRKYHDPSPWEIVSEVTSDIKVQYYYPSGDVEKMYYSFSVDYKTEFFPIETTGYSQIIRLGSAPLDTLKLYAEVDRTMKILYIKRGLEVVDTLDIESLYTSFVERSANEGGSTMLGEDMVFTKQGKVYEAKILLESVTIPNPSYTGTEQLHAGAHGYVLLK